ncbi:MAG: InlB B-repeat-containing protein, partial [Clostridia bacterium]|nr:InlB B-repeat-containing protein [Clostridia bacterium]
MKTKFKSKLLSILLVLAMLLALGLGFGLQNSLVLKVYATDNYLAGSELKIETIIGGKHSTTFAGGKYLHLDPIDKNHYTNNVSANADMEYDETTGVLKIFDTENTYKNFRGYISIIATNTTDKKLTIKTYRGIELSVLDFPHGDLTITNGEDCHNVWLDWSNKLVMTGKLTICGEVDCSAEGTDVGLYPESSSRLSADELEILDSASLSVYPNYNTYTCGVNVRYLTLNTDGYLNINANRNTNNSFTYVLYVAYQVNFTKCLYISLSSPLNTVTSLTNSTYLKNAVDTAPIEGYDAVINSVKTGKYGDLGEDLYRREYDLSRLFNVTYNSNGGTGIMNSEDVRYNGKLTLPACTFTAPAGQQFAGWAVGSADATPLRTPTSYIQIKEPTVIYAVWEDIAVTEYNVTYSDNGGNGTMVGDVVEAGGMFTLEDCTYEAPEGKQFKGWAVGAVNATPLKQAGDQIT